MTTRRSYILPSISDARIAILSAGEALGPAINEALRHEGHDPIKFDARNDIPSPYNYYDIVFVTLGPTALQTLSLKVHNVLAKTAIVVSTTSVCCDQNGFHMKSLPDGSDSMTNMAKRLFPDSSIVGALQQFTAEHIELAYMGAFASDALIIGDDIKTVDMVESLIGELRGFDPVYMGGLRSAYAIEGMTAIIREAAQYMHNPAGFRISSTGLRFET